MKIGIIGAGNIGSTLARKLSAKGHMIKLAASRSPDELREQAEKLGATPVTPAGAVEDVDAIILSIPFATIPDLSGLFADVPPEVVVMDTSNYYPMRDGRIDTVKGGTPESLWVSEQLGRPVVKVFNAVLAHTFAENGRAEGAPDRFAIPVAGDDPQARQIASTLVNDTGFDAFDAGELAESWRQQPGTPAYCTELTLAELPAALAAADKARAPYNREAVMRKLWAGGAVPSHEDIVAANRAIAADSE